ncbi:hypothetical protein DZ860_07020 [Vibrio sinensis]|uniref:Dinitrogenase iron-molybdenum cofactor biosynthesis domain-containing protein n=1 Tax=Vibrio sinensis TaxID=2302434 RepID=A0A3A6R790_9VIBR|nr:NifB/NifX family molybdenum-iron cluster-binding protein [Vibrio sinensis]RJX72902.1 hypothetical protein DZ860_07020 [Vibrio sinensis]
MIFAIPYARAALSAHFSKAPRWMIINDETGQKTLLSAPESTSSCGNKKQLLALFKQYKVQAVIARSIGENMLSALFNNQIEVYSASKRIDFDDLHPSNLTQVTDISYGKIPPKAKKKCGDSHPQCGGRKTSLLSSHRGHLPVSELRSHPILSLRAYK